MFDFVIIIFIMTNFIAYDNSENILCCIDRSIKKAREVEKKKSPYAIVINPKNSKSISLDNLTYLHKDGFKSIPIIKHANVNEKEVCLAYTEPELIEIIKNHL